MELKKIQNNRNCSITIQEDEYNPNYAYVYILQLNRIQKTTNQILIKNSEEDELNFNLNYDGFYTLITLKVPYDWRSPYYFKDGKFYKNIQEVELQEIINTNPEVSGIEISYEYYFQVCKLRKCYVRICQEIFDKQTSIKCNKNNVDNNLIYKRDLIWSTLNVINYMVEVDQYEEAERLLERITGCNGLCGDSFYGNSCHEKSYSNCGCK